MCGSPVRATMIWYDVVKDANVGSNESEGGKLSIRKLSPSSWRRYFHRRISVAY